MLSDFRFALRRLWKNPGFTLAVVLTLGLAIGASTSTFSAVNAVLLRGLPYPDADRLVLLWSEDPKHGKLRGQVSYPDFEDWRTQSHTIEDAAAFTGYWTPALAATDGAVQLNGMRVSDTFFHVMGAQTILGRTFEKEDMLDGRGNVIVISYGLWERRFGRDPKIAGSQVRMNGGSFTVIGVLARNVRPLPIALVDHEATDVYTPLRTSAEVRDGHHLRAIARLKTGVTISEAQQEMDVIAARLASQYPDSNATSQVRVVGLKSDVVRQIRPALLILQGSVLVVLLLGCANVANLLLAQFTSRRRELAIRGALGAGRGQLLRQMLAECLVLAMLSGVAGVLVAGWTLPLIELLGAKVFPDLATINLDWHVIAFSAALSLAAGLVFGLAPAWITSSTDLREALSTGGRGSSGASGGRLRSLLVVTEIAGALALLVCAGLLVGSFARLRGVNPGFDPHDTLVASVNLPGGAYPQDQARQLFFTRLMEELDHTPGVISAGAVSVLPESADFNTQTLDVEGRAFPRNERPSPDLYGVTAGYFRTFAIPLVSGRLFTAEDDMQHVRVAILNETAAKRLWPKESAIGHRVRPASPNEPWRTVIGVVGDVYQYGLDSQKTMQIYLPHGQYHCWQMSVLVRGSDAKSLAPVVRAAVNKIDPDVPVPTVLMDDVMAESIAGRRFSMTVMAAFGCCAVLLAAIGIYGVISYSVAQRTAEFGIRLALGAETRHILSLVIGGGSGWIALGLLLGLGSGFALTRYLSSMLFGVSPRDPATYVGAALLLAGVALLASYVPARRATRVDPIVALRAE